VNRTQSTCQSGWIFLTLLMTRFLPLGGLLCKEQVCFLQRNLLFLAHPAMLAPTVFWMGRAGSFLSLFHYLRFVQARISTLVQSGCLSNTAPAHLPLTVRFKRSSEGNWIVSCNTFGPPHSHSELKIFTISMLPILVLRIRFPSRASYRRRKRNLLLSTFMLCRLC
jgi:hypothetical protein